MLSWLELISFGQYGWGASLLMGALVTIELALASVVFGLLLGMMLTLLKLSVIAPVRWLVDVYLVIIRGTPEFLVLLIVYFSLTSLVETGLVALGIEGFTFPKFIAAVAGLSLIFSAYATEIFRGAYLSVETGQIEAGRAIGLSSAQLFFRIRLPQIWRFAVPGLGNLWMVLLKDTSLAAVIAVDDLLRVAKVASESTQLPLIFYLTAGLLYLVMTGISDIARKRLETKVRVGL